VTSERCLLQAPLTGAVSSPAGSASVGMLGTLVDLGASDPALAACRPDWTATQNLSIHATGWLTDGPVVVDTRRLRLGRKSIIVTADVYDGHGMDDLDELEVAIDKVRTSETDGPTLAARSLVTFARVPGTAARGVDDYNPAECVGQIRTRRPDRPAEGTMYERMALRVVDAAGGVLELERTPYVTNSIGTINGGAQAVLTEAAAEAMRPALVATDMQIHYLSQVKSGPARTVGTVSRDGADHSVVTVDLVDAGHRDQLLAVATVTLQRPPG
jgi:acyl-coenzyme A thioesterase PaaI-like protein